MKHITPDTLDDCSEKVYKKKLAKDKKTLVRAKGVLLINGFKFKDKKKGFAAMFFKKENEAKNAFKGYKAKGYAGGKIGYGTCSVGQNENKEKELKIDIKAGGIAPETIKAKGKDIFKTVLSIKPVVSQSLDALKEQAKAKNESAKEIPTQKEQQKEVAREDKTQKSPNLIQEILEQFNEIRTLIQKNPPVAMIGKVRSGDVKKADVKLMRELRIRLRNWTLAFNASSPKTKEQFNAKTAGKAGIYIRKHYDDYTKIETKAIAQIKAKMAAEADKDKKEDLEQPQVVETSLASNISGSVGAGGKNKEADVKIIQELLNGFGYGLVIDGDCGKKSISAIKAFQSKEVAMQRPDGRIDPGGKSWRALISKGAVSAEEEATTPDNTTDEIIDTKSGISASVGAGGQNKEADVKIIQTLLNKAGHNLTVDGDCGGKSIAAIKAFQKKVMGSERPDGRVDPDGKTWKGLQSGKMDDQTDLMGEHEGKYNYERIAMNLFTKGKHDENEIDPNDVAQGFIGDCYFMSAISAVAQSNPAALKKLIKDKGDGSFDVTLYAKKDKLSLKPEIVNVKPDLPVDEDGNPIYAGVGDKELWVMLLEKAYAKQNGGYDKVGEGGFIEEGIEALTGTEASSYMMESYDEADLLTMIKGALKNKKAITAASEGSGETEITLDSGTLLYQGHAYSIVSVSGKNIELRNPWGYDHATVTVKELKKHFNHIAY